MEIRVLRYFLEIAREGNMTRAAERLHVTCQSDRGGTDSQEKGGRFAGYGGADRKRVSGNG